MVKIHRSIGKKKDSLQRNNFHDDDLVSVEVAADYIGMSVPFVKKWTGTTIPFYKIGASTRFKIADLKEYLENCRVEN